MAPNKTDKIKSLFKLVQKRHKHAPTPPTRNVLEHLIYAAVLENASFEAADQALAILEHHYIDWNEVRVSTAQELADTFPHLPEPLATGERVKRTLQAVFETHYMFDLEDLHKKNITQSHEYLQSIPACSRFMADYVYQVALGGHIIPLDEAALRVFRLLDLAHVNDEGTRENVAGLERVIPKNQGIAFATMLHQFAAGFFNDPELSELRALLKSIDPKSLQRDVTAPILIVQQVKSMTLRPLPPLPVKAVVYDEEEAEVLDDAPVSGDEDIVFLNPATPLGDDLEEPPFSEEPVKRGFGKSAESAKTQTAKKETLAKRQSADKQAATKTVKKAEKDNKKTPGKSSSKPVDKSAGTKSSSVKKTTTKIAKPTKVSDTQVKKKVSSHKSATGKPPHPSGKSPRPSAKSSTNKGKKK